MKYIFIINGRAEKADARNHLQQMLAEEANGEQYEVYTTTGTSDATHYTRSYCETNPDEEVCFVACGGDGTIKEVASGIVGFEHKTLAVMPIGGTGNDFIKYYCGGDLKSGPDFTHVRNIFAGHDQRIDILRINNDYSINVCNFGFDSVVADCANKRIKRGHSKNAYRWGIIKAIFTGRFNRIDVTVDGEHMGSKRMLLCTLANNHYVGGEFFCAPKAKNDDGLIDVCYVRTMSLLGFLRLLPVYTAGKHLDSDKYSKKIIYRQAKHIDVTAPGIIGLCLDGDMLYDHVFSIDILPKAINFRIPA